MVGIPTRTDGKPTGRERDIFGGETRRGFDDSGLGVSCFGIGSFCFFRSTGSAFFEVDACADASTGRAGRFAVVVAVAVAVAVGGVASGSELCPADADDPALRAVIRGLDKSAVASPFESERILTIARAQGIPLHVGATNGGADGSAFVRYGQ